MADQPADQFQDHYSQLFPPPPAPIHTAAYNLRPLSTGEVLDRTFTVYRSRFWLFAGIAAISGGAQLVLNLVQLLLNHVLRLKAGSPVAVGVSGLGGGVSGIIFLLVAAVTQAATVYALSEVYLGRDTTVSSSVRATIGRWYRYIGIAFWQGWSAVWVGLILIVPAITIFVGFKSLIVLGGLFIFLAFGGFIYGIIAYLRNSLAIQASVIEGLKVRPAMRRSKVLTAGTKGRIFVVLLVAALLFYVAVIIESPMLFFILRAPKEEHILAQACMLFVNFFAHTVVTPVGLIGLSLVYFDQRVRKEAFDLQFMLNQQPVPASETPSHAYTTSNDESQHIGDAQQL